MRVQWLRWAALLGICAPYLQGSVTKLFGFDAAIAEMSRFGLAPAGPIAAVLIVFELGCSALILAGVWRWAGALALALFTLSATVVALRFWELPAPGRTAAANAFFEHLGLVGAFVLVAWDDLSGRDPADLRT